MTDNGAGARKEGYWDEVGASRENVIQALQRIEGNDGWTVHAVVLSGESGTSHFATVVRSKVGDSGLLLSERMVQLPKDMGTASDISMLDNSVTRRVSGPLARALTRAYARADNDRLAADDLDAEPLALSAVGADVQDDPAALCDPINDEHDPRESSGDRHGETVECSACGNPIQPDEERVNIGSALGTDVYSHAGKCPDEVSDE